eukprot:gene17493-23047_t
MRRVGGYLFVLLLVWLPNMIFNIFSIAANSNTEYLSLFQIGIALSSLQGFLNGSFNGSFRGSNTNGILKKYTNNSNIAPIVRIDDKSQVTSTKVNVTQNKSAPITIQELDSEKYVRFGGITTKVISTSFSRFTFTRNSDESVSNLDSL